MNLPLLIALNALLDLAVVVAVFAVVRATHRFDRHDPKPIAIDAALPVREVEELAEAA